MNTPAGAGADTAACENCATALRGHYCHQCGQHAHNPLHSFAHAVEEVLESFWHLDGRIVRTLRDLLAPGKLATRFLGGHRAPYIPPLRLFVILSVLTFFVAQFAIHVDSDTAALAKTSPFEIPAKGIQANPSRFSAQATVAAVAARRDQRIAAVQRNRSQAPKVALLQQAIDLEITQIRTDAQARIHQLDPAQPAMPEPLADPAPTAAHAAHAAHAQDANVLAGLGLNQGRSTVQFDMLPGFANRWINKKLARAQLNLKRYSAEPGEFVHVVIAAIPTALFVLVPVFALLLKVLYLGSGRGYLEHLVVGLYSHAFIVLSLLAVFVLMIIRDALPSSASWVSTGVGLLEGLVWLWLPVYLWRMQWRVYRETWWLTSLKYLVIGHLYFLLVGVVALLPLLSGVLH